MLSGMGSDGSLGLRHIKEKAGVTLAQQPASAKFDSTPRSVIDAGLADIVAPAGQVPGKIPAYLELAPLAVKPTPAAEAQSRGALEKVLMLLRARTGHDFSFYKPSTLDRRIKRRMGIYQIDRIPAYARFLQENPQELELLFTELLIGVTGFFRDPPAWQVLRDTTLPALLATHQRRQNP